MPLRMSFGLRERKSMLLLPVPLLFRHFIQCLLWTYEIPRLLSLLDYSSYSVYNALGEERVIRISLIDEKKTFHSSVSDLSVSPGFICEM